VTQAEPDDTGLHVEGAALDAGITDNSETIDEETPAPLDRCRDIDDFDYRDTTPRLRLAEQGFEHPTLITLKACPSVSLDRYQRTGLVKRMVPVPVEARQSTSS
jgi:hypothetical protein